MKNRQKYIRKQREQMETQNIRARHSGIDFEWVKNHESR
jgi:hypothetical protein